MSFDFHQHPGRNLNASIRSGEGQPLVTIVTPFYNSGDYIQTTANCVFNQTFPYFEWIIVNDGSTKSEAVALLEEIAAQDKRVKVLHKDNGGPALARNLAIANSTTDIIVSLDADDLIDPTYLECGYFTLYTHPEAGWCYSNSVGFGNLEYLWERPFDTETLKTENFLTEVAMIRKAALLEVGCYDASEKHAYEDWHLWLKLLRAAHIPVHINYFGSWYRRNDDGVFGSVRLHQGKHEQAMTLIQQVASEVDSSLGAIEFPLIKDTDFTKPYKWRWDRPSITRKDKCKVLMILPWLNMGGADKFNLDVVSRADRERYEFTIATTVPGEYGWRQQFEEHVTDLFDLTSFLSPKDWAAFIHYLITSRQIDVVMVSNSYYGYYLIPWLKKEFPDLPIVDYVHMEEWYWRKGGFARTSAALSDLLDQTYVCTRHLKDVMVQDFGRQADDIEVVYINVDESDAFNPEHVERGVIRREAGVSEQDPVVLFPCRIHPQKRPFMMLEIAQAVKKELPSIKFFVVGDGPDLPQLKEQTEKAGLRDTLLFFGNRNDMKHFYADANLTLICSIKEGLTLTSYESLSMGLPVISADVGGQKELIDDKVGRIIPFLQDEVSDFSSLRFPPEEVRLYADAIIEILRDQHQYEQMCRNARERIVRDFNMSKMISLLEDRFWAYKERRLPQKKAQALSLQTLPHLANDYLTLYNEFVAKEAALDELWVRSQAGLHSESTIQELQQWIQQLHEGKDWLEGKYHEYEGQIRELREWASEVEKGKNWLERKYAESEKEVRKRDKEIAQLKKQLDKQSKPPKRFFFTK